MAKGSGSLSSLRELNRLRIVDFLRVNGTASRAELARRTGLSRSTVSTLVADLQRRGLVVEQPGQFAGEGQPGRPAALLQLDPSAGAVSTMEHHVLQVHGADKYATATEIAARDGRVIMFLDTKHAVDQFTKHLLSSGVKAAALHGGKSQPQRTRTLARFKTGDVTTLVATNVAARGIHVDDLDLVVNVDPPSDHKDYLHRGGRTARALPHPW